MSLMRDPGWDRLLRGLLDDMQRLIDRAIGPWTKGGKLDLGSPNSTGILPTRAGGTDSTLGAYGQVQDEGVDVLPRRRVLSLVGAGRQAREDAAGARTVDEIFSFAAPGAPAVPASDASYSAAVLADAPLHLWKLQELAGTAAADATAGTAEPGAWSGAPTLGLAGPTADSKAAGLDGVDDYLAVPHAADQNITADITLEAWVYPLDRATTYFLATKGVANGAATNTFEWRLEPGTGKAMFLANGANNVLATAAPPVGAWSHLAARVAAGTVTHYLAGSPNGAGALGGARAACTSPITIGTRDDRNSYAKLRLAYVALWNSALTDARVRAHYLAGVGLQPLAGGREGTLPPAYFAGTYNVKAFGAVGDGTTDDTAAVNAAIAAALGAGGGTVYFPPGPSAYKCAGDLAFPTTLVSGVPRQAPLRLTGGGAANNFGFAAIAGSRLDLRGTGLAAKLLTLGVGNLEIDHLTILDGGGSATPFLQTTRTVLNIHDACFAGSKSGTACDQDAIVLGGTAATDDGTAASPFAGYGTTIRRCQFPGIRRAIFGRRYCNGVVVRDNAIPSGAGSNLAGGAAIELNGQGADDAHGNVVVGNTVEVTDYTYAIKAEWAHGNTFGPNGFYDATGGLAAYHRFEANASGNLVIDGVHDDTKPAISDASTAGNYRLSGHVAGGTMLPLLAIGLGGTPIRKHLSGTATYDPPSVAPGAQATTTVAVAGAAVGDTVAVGFGQSLQGMQLTGYVSATGTVTVVLQNGTAGALDLASATLRADVWQH